MANKYLALNIILWQNKNATVISMKFHKKKILYANMNGIYIFGEYQNRNLFRRSNEKKSDTISKFGSSRTFMNSNRYEIANQWLEYYTKKKKNMRKFIQVFLWKIALYIFSELYFGHNAKNDHVFDALWWPFLWYYLYFAFLSILASRKNEKISFFFSYSIHWLIESGKFSLWRNCWKIQSKDVLFVGIIESNRFGSRI